MDSLEHEDESSDIALEVNKQIKSLVNLNVMMYASASA